MNRLEHYNKDYSERNNESKALIKPVSFNEYS